MEVMRSLGPQPSCALCRSFGVSSSTARPYLLSQLDDDRDRNPSGAKPALQARTNLVEVIGERLAPRSS
jgi:hypothetical protein